MQVFLDKWIPFGGSNNGLKLFLFVVVFWVLWNVRNKRAIVGEFILKPSQIMLKFLGCVQKWKCRLCADDQERLDMMMTFVQFCWLEDSFL
jgi:hypothetical protein